MSAVIFDKPWLSIVWDDEHQCVYAEFKTFANSAELRSGALQILEAIKGMHSTALVSDNRRLEGVTHADQLWLRDEWMPLAVRAGIQRIAVVLPARGLGKVASEEIIGLFGKTEFVTRTFSSVDDAKQWASR